MAALVYFLYIGGAYPSPSTYPPPGIAMQPVVMQPAVMQPPAPAVQQVIYLHIHIAIATVDAIFMIAAIATCMTCILVISLR